MSKIIISFSGAHSTGKSTLISDLTKSLGEKDVLLIPSCSKEWFKLKNDPKCQTYDDINKLGLRSEMQSQLPIILHDLIKESITKEQKIVLVDRWFTDILAYSSHEHSLLQMSDESLKSIIDISISESKKIIFLLKSVKFKISNVFIPISSCTHKLIRGEGPDGKPRSTLPQLEWEKHYHDRERDLPIAGEVLRITSSDRLQRVEEIRSRFRI